MRACYQFVLLAAFATVAASCDKSTPNATKSPVAQDSTAPAPSAARVADTWNADAGPVLLVEGSSRAEAIVLFPHEDSALAVTSRIISRSTPITLLGRGGGKLSAQLIAAPGDTVQDCHAWPLSNIRGDGAAQAWAIGFASTNIEPIVLDSVDVLSARDSMMLVAEATRLASGVTALTLPVFQGLRFTAHDIRRFSPSPGVQALVAHVIRKVNQEANPQEEQTLLIAERDSGATSGAYHLVYAERETGLEDQVVTLEPVGAARIAGVAALVVARDGEAGVAYAIVERSKAGLWRVRWKSTPTNCSQ